MTLRAAAKQQPGLTRFLCHLYQRRKQKRVTLVTGAGISADAGVPSWDRLLERLSASEKLLKGDVKAHKKRRAHQEYIGQIVYHRYREACGGDRTSPDWPLDMEQFWAGRIHSCLYKDVSENIGTIMSRHPYLKSLCKFAIETPLVINFNFDDILDAAIAQYAKKLTIPNWNVSSTWKPPVLEKEGGTVVYHVNGMLPRVELKKRSEELIFTEDSFSNALSRAPDVGADAIFLKFVQNTMLILGHSLSDSSLKSYLRRNREKSPANHHYMIYWLDKGVKLPDSQRNDIFEANLELYNVITVFLTSKEICEFLDLLSCDSEPEFSASISDIGPYNMARYCYYIVGSVASGKSSVVEQLRCFNTHEEWTRPPPPEMYMSSSVITAPQRAIIDRFVYSQLAEKNARIVNEKVGIHFMDRAPLDLYAFSKSPSENLRKTKELKKVTDREGAFHPGEIIFLQATGATVVKRNKMRGRMPSKSGDESYFELQRDNLKEVYRVFLEVNADTQAPGEIARKIARHALLEPYSPINLMDEMVRYA